MTVQYDLTKPGQDYSGLIEEIRRSQDWCRPVESTWLVSSDETPRQLIERLRPHLDGNDKILINEVKTPFQWSALNLSEKVVAWIRKYSP